MEPKSFLNPYYSDELVSLFLGDARVFLPRIKADVIVTDPPYGIGFKSGWTGAFIQNDNSTDCRDEVLRLWTGPALVFGAAGEATLLGAKTTLIWHRPGSGMCDLASPWKPDYELIHVFGSGFVSSSRGSSVLVFPWDVFRGNALHPHQKPVALMSRLIQACPPEWVILDPFAGSGSTLVAAKMLGRKAIGVEIEEKYAAEAALRCSQGVLFGME